MTHHLFRSVCGCLLAVCILAAPAAAQDKASAAPQVTPEAVRAAMERARAYLYKTQKPNGHWEKDEPKPKMKDGKPVMNKAGFVEMEGDHTFGVNFGGTTAIVTYALLASGESHQKPEIKKAIEWLMKHEITGTYAIGMRAQVWTFLPANYPGARAAAKKDADWLAKGLITDNTPWRAKWGYTPAKNHPDHSVSQYGVLGLWALDKVGLEVKTGVWQEIDAAWKQTQSREGAWCYELQPKDNHPYNLSMTAAGVATLFITQDYLMGGSALKCDGNVENASLERGLKWMRENTNDAKLKEMGDKRLYTLYGIERIGVASGLKYFGTVDWYQWGAQILLKEQQKDGNWNGQGGPGAATSFAMLFLSRGGAPVAVNKLQYEFSAAKDKQSANWSQRPRDIANVIHWMGDQIERPLNWQIVNLKVAAKDLHDAPVLYISGNQKLELSAEDEAKLKDFVEQGGLIVGNPDCAERAFSTSFRELGTKLFNTEFRELPEDHLIYTIHFKRDQMKKKPRWQGLSNGARELMILIGDDAARSWQGNQYGGNDADFQTMLNVYKYTIDRDSMREKGKTHIVTADPKATPKQTLKLARGEYEGNWNPEPGGWPRFKAVMLNQNAVGLDVSTVKLGSGGIPSDVKVLHITGTGPLNLSEPAREAIRKYVNDGGTLVIDAAGGSSEFATAAESLLTALFPLESKQLDTPIKADHGLFSAAGKKLEEFRYRGGVRGVEGRRSPNLRGIELNGRLAVLYSREDLSVGLVGMSMAGIAGYDPDVATELMKNIVLYAQNPKK